MGLNLRHLLRRISPKTLKPFLASLELPPLPEESWESDEPELARALFEHICALPDESRTAVFGAAQRVKALACERGRNAILNAARNREEIATTFRDLNSDCERSAWTYTADRSLFQAAEELYFFDDRAGGQLCRSFHGPKGAVVSRDTAVLDAFQSDLQDFFRRRDGSGRCCAAEVVERFGDGSVQVTVYVEDLPSEAPEFVNGTMRRRMAHPAIEAAIVYSPEDGTTTTVTRGGKDVHEAVRRAFAERLLKSEPTFDPVQPRRYHLNQLLQPRAFPTDPQHGIEQVRVRRLKLVPSGRKAGALVIEAPAGQPHISAYGLAGEWLGTDGLFTSAFAVDQATISLHLRLQEGRRRPKTVNVELSMPNRSNLKNLSEADRMLAEHYLNKWALVEKAA